MEKHRSRRRLRNKRLGVLCVSLLTLAMIVPFAGGMETASALGTTHRLATSDRNEGNAVEGAARLSFYCNDATGVFHVRLTGVQVIEPDGHTPWASLTVTFIVFPGETGYLTLTLTQNAGNGLFQFVGTDTLVPSDCATGSQLAVYHEDNWGQSLWLQSPLT